MKKNCCAHLFKEMCVHILAVLGIDPGALHILGELSYTSTPLLFNFGTVSH